MELREKVLELMPTCSTLKGVWLEGKEQEGLISAQRHRKNVSLPNVAVMNAAKGMDVVGRYSLYREGAWARASSLLAQAGGIHAMDDVIVHPETLKALKLEAGDLTVVSSAGEEKVTVGTRSDVSPGVIFIAKRGAAGDISGDTSVDLKGGL